MQLVRCNVGLKTSHSTRSSLQLSIHVRAIPIMLQHKWIVRKAKGSLLLCSLSFSLSPSPSCARARKSECTPGRIPILLHRPRVSRQSAARKFDARNAMPDAYCGDRELIALELCYSVKSFPAPLPSSKPDTASLQRRAMHSSATRSSIRVQPINVVQRQLCPREN